MSGGDALDGVAEDAVERAIAALRAGEAIVVPTDTVYGLAAVPTVSGAVDRLYALKGRPAEMPIAVLVAGIEQVEALAELSDAAWRLADAFWPGPLTLVLPRRPGLALPLGGSDATIGVRWPDHPLIGRLATEVGPLATTSANRTGEPTPGTATEAAASLVGPVGAVLDGGACAGTASTVVDVTGSDLRVLREGELTEDRLRAAL